LRPINLRDIEAKARALAAKPYAHTDPLPGFLSEISYDAWRDIPI